MKSLSLRLNIQTVQFFFIEETGSYPLLTRAIYFLSFKEPMVRTAAQATILNVFRITEVRAREYALQDHILDDLLTTITAVLNAQYASMSDICFRHRTSRHDIVLSAQIAEMDPHKVNLLPSTEGSNLSFEHQMASAVLGFEDWMYYLQDMIDLKIPRLTHQLVTRLVQDFVLGTLLVTIERCDSSASHSSKTDVDKSSFSESLPHDLTQASLSLFIICQIFRVFTSPEIHRAIMVAMLHPLNMSSRKYRIRQALNCSDMEPPDASLAEKLMRVGFGVSKLNSPSIASTARKSLESNHPELLKKREEQIASVSTRLRVSSTSSNSLSRISTSEGNLNTLTASPQSQDRSDMSIGDIGLSDCTAAHYKEHNSSRRGFELFFTEELDQAVQDAKFVVQNDAIPQETESLRCSLLACLVLQSLCSSLVSLIKRDRYDVADKVDENQLTAAAFYIYSHLFQSMSLWPVLSSEGSIYPPSSLYWNSQLIELDHYEAVRSEDGNSVVLLSSVDNTSPSNILEFDEGQKEHYDTKEANPKEIVALKLDMEDVPEGCPVESTGESIRTKPSDFDVSIELAFSASTACSNPFTSEPGVSIGAGKRLCTDGAALRPGEDLDYSPLVKEPHHYAKEDIPELLDKFKDMDWIDPNIVPIPVLDALFEKSNACQLRWGLTRDLMSIPVMLGSLLATERAHQSLALMQVCYINLSMSLEV